MIAIKEKYVAVPQNGTSEALENAEMLRVSTDTGGLAEWGKIVVLSDDENFMICAGYCDDVEVCDSASRWIPCFDGGTSAEFGTNGIPPRTSSQVRRARFTRAGA